MRTAQSITHKHTVSGKVTSLAGAHDHDLADVTAALASLAARVTALEAPPVEPPPAEPPPPPPPPSAWPWASFAAAVAGTPSGGTIDAGGRTFNERITITKPLTIRNATFLGTGLGVALQKGLLEITGSGATGVTIENVRCTGSSGSGISIHSGPTHVLVKSCELDNNIQQGYHATGVADITFDGCHIHHNNVALTVDPLWEAGGGKVTNCQRVIFRGCEVDHNGGPGIWYDINANEATIEGNYTHDNTHAGIFFEISDGAIIRNNRTVNDGLGDRRGWFWGAGILVSSSRNAEVYGNVVKGCQTGIAVLSQKRASNPGDNPNWDAVVSVFIHDNDVVMNANAGIGEWSGISFAQDWAGGTMYGGTNRSAGNRFWFPVPEPTYGRFGWNVSVQMDTLAKFNASPYSAAPSRYMSDAEKAALL